MSGKTNFTKIIPIAATKAIIDAQKIGCLYGANLRFKILNLADNLDKFIWIQTGAADYGSG